MDSCQCSPTPCQCFPSPAPGAPLHIPLVWVVRAIMLGSMQLQLFLVVFGARRYFSSNPVLRFVVWGAYLAADAVAISALGIMTHSIKNVIYGLWAPILLIHLGGPDSITAYSIADNELWTRHFFIMFYQVLIAGYVIYISRLEGRLLAASILLFIAGASKYFERTCALRSASNSQMVNSTNALYKFMQVEGTHDREDYNYVVMGEQRLRQIGIPKTGESTLWNSLVSDNAIVTIKKVFEQEGRLKTEKYIFCLSHALFKMYKRRFVSLSFHEGALPKTRIFFITERLNCEKVFGIIEMELKFMYDVLFSKSGSTAFSMCGIALRLLNTCFLAVAAYLVFFQLTKKPAHKTVTFVIISVALAVEIIQLCRIALSDWTMVYLICAHIKDFSRPKGGGWYTVQMINFLMNLLGHVRKLWKKYWKNKINQYSITDARGESLRFMLQRAKSNSFCRSLVPLYLRVCHMNEEDSQNELNSLKSFIFEIVKDKCTPEQDIKICRDRIYDPDEYLISKSFEVPQEQEEIQLEDTILAWHIATSICEARDQAKDLQQFKVAIMLSRYFVYLLLVHPNILPLHADIAVLSFIDLQVAIIEKPKDVSSWSIDMTANASGNDNLRRSIHLADLLMKRSERWDIMAHYWGELLIYVAAYNKAPLHAECIASGGEFISQVWALLGHLGCGEQSDTAVTKRKDTKIDQGYLAEKRREEDQRNKRAKEIKRRQEKKKEMTVQEIHRERSEEDQNMKDEEEKETTLKSFIEEDEKKKKLQGRLKSIIEDPLS
ncbi:uncharacterized protein LOC131857174 [Cryptomeria japonica]|uniref:uncharacterized protein LOC131857174 n=1 Tax=Cryptomeria japonica TaxID=3369 RepID=UPI0027DA6195|nr:uncharacterized protein LOC131857174 [Cryptomeria japonica]